MGEKAEKALKEFHEVWEKALKTEQEALSLAKAEGKKDYALIQGKLREAEGFLKKRNDALKRYLHHLKRGE